MLDCAHGTAEARSGLILCSWTFPVEERTLQPDQISHVVFVYWFGLDSETIFFGVYILLPVNTIEILRMKIWGNARENVEDSSMLAKSFFCVFLCRLCPPDIYFMRNFALFYSKTDV